MIIKMARAKKSKQSTAQTGLLTQDALTVPTTVATTHPQQMPTVIQMTLELILTSENNTRIDTWMPCESILADSSPYVIPGADASLCRCPECLKAAPGGIWWVQLGFRYEWHVWRSGEFNPKTWNTQPSEPGAIKQSEKIRARQMRSKSTLIQRPK